MKNDEGLQIAGAELRDVTESCIQLSRTIDQLTVQINNRDVIEQAAIAGILNLEMLGNAEAATYLAKRLDQISDPLSAAGRLSQEQAQMARISRLPEPCAALPKPITSTVNLFRQVKPDKLDSAAGLLQKILLKGYFCDA